MREFFFIIDQGLCPNIDICGRVIDESDSEISKQAKKQDKKPFCHIGLRKVYVTGCHRGGFARRAASAFRSLISLFQVLWCESLTPLAGDVAEGQKYT